jgi:hypothetical protein
LHIFFFLGCIYSNCAFIYKLIDEEFGFSCEQSLKSLVGQDVSLSDVCCATCKKMNKPKKTTPKPKACGSPQYKGDGNCDDNNNHKGCGYDGGDCCVASVKGGKVKKDYCKAVGFVTDGRYFASLSPSLLSAQEHDA